MVYCIMIYIIPKQVEVEPTNPNSQNFFCAARVGRYIREGEIALSSSPTGHVLPTIKSFACPKNSIVMDGRDGRCIGGGGW